MLSVALGADHAGWELKEALKRTNKVLDDLSLSLLASLINAKAFKSLDELWDILNGIRSMICCL